MSVIDLGEFMKFCKDFEIQLPKSKQQEIFKKQSGHKPLKFEQFDSALTRIGIELNRAKIDEVTQRLKIVMKQIRSGGGG